MRSKQERLQAIKEIIDTQRISTQEELIVELEKRDFEVTQATVSRDISDLGLQKVRIVSDDDEAHAARLTYSLPEVEHLRALLNEFTVSTDRAENLVVVKTAPAMAQAVAAAIDAVKWMDVLGTVGGDDTILIITRSVATAEFIIERISKLSREKAL